MGGFSGWDVLLAVAMVVQAAVLVGWPRVVTIDGPAHLAAAAALLHSGEPSQALYEVSWFPVPNVLGTVLLAALLVVFGPDGAERVLVLGYAVGLPLAMRYALRGVEPGAGWLAVAAVPFVGGYLYVYGFYDLCLGLVGWLVIIGLALRQRSGWSPGAAAALGVLLLLTWAAHLLPVVVAGLLLVVLGLCRVRAAAGGGLRAALLAHLLPPLVAGLPVLALTAVFAVSPAGQRGPPVRIASVGSLLVGLLDLGRPLVVWTIWEYAGSALVAVGLLAVTWSGRAERRRCPERSALAVTGVLLAAWYLASPDRYGPAYGFLNDRLSLFPPLLLVLWAAFPAPSRRGGRVGVAVLLLGALSLIGLRLPTDIRYQRDVAELLSVAPQVPRGTTIVALRLWRDAPVGPDARNRARDPLRHEAGRMAVLTGGVDVGDYQAVTHYFPVRFRRATDPRRAIDPDLQGLDRIPSRVDLTHGPQTVLLIGRTRATRSVLARADTVRLLGQLSSRYRRVATSRPHRLVEVWISRRYCAPAVHRGSAWRSPGTGAVTERAAAAAAALLGVSPCSEVTGVAQPAVAQPAAGAQERLGLRLGHSAADERLRPGSGFGR